MTTWISKIYSDKVFAKTYFELEESNFLKSLISLFSTKDCTYLKCLFSILKLEVAQDFYTIQYE